MNALRPTDPVRQLLRALTRSAAAAGCAATFDHDGQTPWASVTFTGARHRVQGTADDTLALAHWLAMLPEADLPLHGCFVASCAAELADGQAMIRLLVLEG